MGKKYLLSATDGAENMNGKHEEVVRRLQAFCNLGFYCNLVRNLPA